MSIHFDLCALLVEDNIVNIKLFKKAFQSSFPGWKLYVVRDAVNALLAMEQKPFIPFGEVEYRTVPRIDIVYLDNTFLSDEKTQEMVSDLGISTANKVRGYYLEHNQLGKPPKIAAYSTDEKKEFNEFPFDANLSKPCQRADLIACCTKLGLPIKI